MQGNTVDYESHVGRSWFVVLVAGLFFFYEFIQMNMFDTISQVLIHAFSLDAGQLGVLSSVYFMANVVFLFVAGLLLDRCSTKGIIVVALAVCVVGTFLFSLANSFTAAAISRFLTGIGSAFCFLSVIRLASRWFPPRHMALVLGVVVTMAMTGGLVSQTPLTEVVSWVGWREALRMDAYLGVLILLLIVFFVRDFPRKHAKIHEQEQRQIHQLGYWRSWCMAFLRIQNWLGGIYTSTMNLPINVLGGLWGIMYVTKRYQLSHIDAANLTMMLFLGAIIGCPIAGWVSDRMGVRRPPMIVGAVLCLLITLAIIYLPHPSYFSVFILFLLLGIISSVQVVGYPLVAESSPRVVTATSVSIVNITTVAGIGVIQALFGYMMDVHIYHRLHHMSTHFILPDFSWAILLFPLGYVVALLASLVVKETHCHQSVE
ncbi:MAG: MFS transporter [Gammaproteobacteria bacterium]|nr:MFS transporter [Gammaproteobacteria bacterium]MCH9743513.1 MFS transporter [Gammaproteobacteria bacterium]